MKTIMEISSVENKTKNNFVTILQIHVLRNIAFSEKKTLHKTDNNCVRIAEVFQRVQGYMYIDGALGEFVYQKI